MPSHGIWKVTHITSVVLQKLGHGYVVLTDLSVLLHLGTVVKNQYCSFLHVMGTNGRGKWPRALPAPG